MLPTQARELLDVVKEVLEELKKINSKCTQEQEVKEETVKKPKKITV